MIKSKLVDKRSIDDCWDQLLAEVRSAKILGIDCETQDEARHAGLNSYNTGRRHVFDHRRTTMTGFSVYADGSDTAWYLNLAHADAENRIPLAKALELIAAIPEDCLSIAHNASFEHVMFEQCLGVTLNNTVCTLQMAVSHHGIDEYKIDDFSKASLASFRRFVPDILREFAAFDPQKPMRSNQAELLGKLIAKESKAEHSYNGFVKSIATGYNLKKLVQSLFGFQMTTYDEVLKAAGAKHMGELTGDQVCSYGADDAYWAVKVYHHMFNSLRETNPSALVTFFKTENAMVLVYADTWREGLRLNLDEVYVRRDEERKEMAVQLRKLKPLIRSMLPFQEGPCVALCEKQANWYIGYDKTGNARDNWAKKREQIEAWANSPDNIDDFTEASAVSNPIGNAWADEKGITLPKSRLNITYYQTMRTILHDLMGHKLIYSDGEVSSDKDARGKILDQCEQAGETTKVELLKVLQEMAEIEQRMKLYLTPYTQLMDPDTGRVYPVLSSQLATRRLAASFPNPMQLAKRGNSTYIRGFYLADTDDEVVISADWSAVELVLVGDQSGDPEFAKVYGQLPYGDLHTGAAADCLAVKTLPGLTEEELREFKFGRNPQDRVLKDVKTGLLLSPSDFFKMARSTDVGKGANFSYWYSGALSTVGNTLGWTSEEMWEAVDRYRQRFQVAEAWRVGVCEEVAANGYVTLPDGHTRVRFEATDTWASMMRTKFADLSASPAMLAYADLAIKRIRSRAKNQAVNAMIQGTCAALAKRSVLNLQKLCADAGIADKYRFMMPIHDELVFSVHKSVVIEFIALLRQAMVTHPELVKTLPLDCTVAIGRTFQPFNKADPRLTQIELDEAQVIEGVIGKDWEGKKLSDDKVREVLDFITSARLAA